MAALPPSHRLKAAKRKLAWAAKHLQALKRCIADYSASRPFKIVSGDMNGKKTTQIKIIKRPPLEVSILAGQMIYQMRSALDHLAFALVERNATNAILPARWEERCQFPMRDNIPLVKGKAGLRHSIPVPYSEFSRDLPGLSVKAFTFIESVQPYYRGGKVNNTLAILSKLSNIDKHRYLNTIVSQLGLRQTVRYRSGISIRGTETFEHGAKFSTHARSKPDRVVYMNRRFRPTVRFDEATLKGTPIPLPLDDLLKFMLENIRVEVVPAFEQLLK